MNEGQFLEANDLKRIKSIGGQAEELASAAALVSIRVSPQSYLTALLLGTFFSGFLFYLEIDLAGVILFGLSWILIPFFAFRDHIRFDGKRLVRTGTVPRIWSWVNASRRRLKLVDIEQVETEAVRTIKRGDNVFYSYRTVIRGKGLSVAIASGASGGNENYRRFIKSILPQLSENLLDNRSIELRDHLADPKETLMRAEFSRIPPADVLEGSLRNFNRPAKHTKQEFESLELFEDEKADDLRSLANELRLSGYLLQALEAFRRALILKPADARLLFEFARCLHSFAGMKHDKKLEHRALAALRLSEKRGAQDGELLMRLGEWYFQIGNWRRAGNTFRDALGRLGENFRTARGLGEIALREGKIAHVIHHFATANRVAETTSLRRWSKNEADYFSHLNSDDEYMELEISRVNLLEGVERSKRTALRIAFFGFPAIVTGLMLEDNVIANIGWAVSTVALLIWTGLIFSARIFSQRIPYEMVETDD